MEPNIESFARTCTNLNIRKQNATTNQNIRKQNAINQITKICKNISSQIISIQLWELSGICMGKHVYSWIFCIPKAKMKIGFNSDIIKNSMMMVRSIQCVNPCWAIFIIISILISQIRKVKDKISCMINSEFQCLNLPNELNISI